MKHWTVGFYPTKFVVRFSSYYCYPSDNLLTEGVFDWPGSKNKRYSLGILLLKIFLECNMWYILPTNVNFKISFLIWCLYFPDLDEMCFWFWFQIKANRMDPKFVAKFCSKMKQSLSFCCHFKPHAAVCRPLFLSFLCFRGIWLWQHELLTLLARVRFRRLYSQVQNLPEQACGHRTLPP